MKKRPVGVVILGIIIIIGSIMTLFSAVAGANINPMLSTVFYLIISPLSIVAAIFLFRLNNLARIVIITISILVAAETTLTAQYAMKRTEAQLVTQMEGEYGDKLVAEIKAKNPNLTEQQILQVKDMAKERSLPLMRQMFIIALALSVGFNLIVVYYFNRSSVVLQFK